MDQLIHCSKCNTIPYDVLMMNCNHNLCVKCAVQRMQDQHSSKNALGKSYLQCQRCKTRTNLDQQSIVQLQKVQKNKGYIQKIYFDKDAQKRVQTPINTGRNKNNEKKQQKKVGKSQIKPQQPQSNQKQNSNLSKNANELKKQKQTKNTIQRLQSTEKQNIKNQNSPDKSKQVKKVEKQAQYTQSNEKLSKSRAQVNYGACDTHKQQPVMYYCFTCNIHCFCAECILHGKHNNHDVKVIRKAFSQIEGSFRQAIMSTKSHVSQLLQKKKQITNDINTSKNKIDSLKRKIEKGFDQIRGIVRNKEIQFMKLVDQQFMRMMEVNNGVIKKTIDGKLREQQDLLNKLDSTYKKGQKFVLNFYADQWQKLAQLMKNQAIKLPSAQLSFNQMLSQYTSEIKNQIERIQPKSFQR